MPPEIDFARTVRADGDTLDDRLDIPCSADLKQRTASLARIYGFPSAADYVRVVLEKHLSGEEAWLRKVARSQPRVDGTNLPDR